MALDLRVPFDLGWSLGSVLSALALAAVLAWFAVLCVKRRAGLGPLPVVLAAFPFLYSASSFTWLVEEPRYVVLLMPMLALLLAPALTRPAVAPIALAAAVALSATGLARMQDAPRYQTRTGHYDVPDDLEPLLRALRERRVKGVVAEYWIAHRITFESGEEIVATSTRHPEFSVQVARRGDPAHVLVAGSADERRQRSRLEREGYQRAVVGGFALYSR